MFESFFAAVFTFLSDINALLAVIAWITGIWFVFAGGLLIWSLKQSQAHSHIHPKRLPAIAQALAWMVVPIGGVMLCNLSLEPQNDLAWNSLELDGGQMSSTDQNVQINGLPTGWLLTYPDPTLDPDQACEEVIVAGLTTKPKA